MKYKLDHIEEIIGKTGSIKFAQIMIKLSEITGVEYNSQEISSTFTDVNIDKRFIHLGDNVWDLRANHPYSKVHLPINEIYESQDDAAGVSDDLDDEIKSFIEKK